MSIFEKGGRIETVVAIVAIAALEIVAMACGQDGVALSAAIGTIAAIGGYHLRAVKKA